MRIDLKVPFAEKDTAKALGARWAARTRIETAKELPRPLQPEYLFWLCLAA